MKFLQNYENIQNWNYLKTLLIRITHITLRFTMHKKPLKFVPLVELAKLNFTYITVLTWAKARPGFDDRPEYPSVQINSSSPCVGTAPALLWAVTAHARRCQPSTMKIKALFLRPLQHCHQGFSWYKVDKNIKNCSQMFHFYKRWQGIIHRWYKCLGTLFFKILPITSAEINDI